MRSLVSLAMLLASITSAHLSIGHRHSWVAPVHRSPSPYTVEDEMGRESEVFFANFSRPLQFVAMQHQGPSERTLILLARVEAFARQNDFTVGETEWKNNAHHHSHRRLFGFYWEAPKGKYSAAACAVTAPVEDPAEDIYYREGRVGPYVVMHRKGEHSSIGQLYETIFRKVFPKWDLQNRTVQTSPDTHHDDDYSSDQTTDEYASLDITSSEDLDETTTELGSGVTTETDDDDAEIGTELTGTGDDATEAGDEGAGTNGGEGQEEEEDGMGEAEALGEKGSLATTEMTRTADPLREKGQPQLLGKKGAMASERSRMASSAPPSHSIIEEYEYVASTAIAWSSELVTTVYIPIEKIPMGVHVEANLS